MGQNEVQWGTCWGTHWELGTHVGNTLGTWDTCWEHIGNLIKILWKHIGNMLVIWGTCLEPIQKLIEHIKNNKNPINMFILFPLPPSQRKKMCLLDACNKSPLS